MGNDYDSYLYCVQIIQGNMGNYYDSYLYCVQASIFSIRE